MEIRYWEPVELAYARTRRMLFAPFNFGKWAAMGFSGWLAHITEMQTGTYFQFGFPRGEVSGDTAYHEYFHDFIPDHHFWVSVAAVLFLLSVLIAAVILMLWLCARFRFIFLDHVSGDRTDIARPWRRYAHQGNSLFLWWIGFGLAAGAVASAVVSLIAFAIIRFDNVLSWQAVLILAALSGLLFLAFLLALFLLMLINDFIVPIMYKHEIRTHAAWRLFYANFRNHAGSIILYTLVRIGLNIAIGMAIFLAVIMTCCCAGIILAIPYIGAVCLLPVHVFMRAFSLYFLRQWGDEFDAIAVSPPLPVQ